MRPRPSPHPGLEQGAGAGVQRVLVERDVGDAGVVVERVLRAVAVVGVVVDDRAPARPASASAAAVTATLLNRQNPMAWVGERVVARRAHRAERGVGLARAAGASTAVEPGAGGPQRGRPTTPAPRSCRRRGGHRRSGRSARARRRRSACAPARGRSTARPRPPTRTSSSSRPDRGARPPRPPPAAAGRSGWPMPVSWSRNCGVRDEEDGHPSQTVTASCVDVRAPARGTVPGRAVAYSRRQ